MAATCVNSAKGEASASNTVNTSGATFTSAATGSTFFIQVHCDPAITITIPADSKGNAYTLVSRQTSGSTSCAVYKCENGVGGAGHYATANLSAANYPALLFTEWSDTGKTVVVDTASLAGASDTSSPFTVTSGTFDAASTAAYLGTSDDATGSPITKSESTGFSSIIQATDDNNFYGGSVWQKALSGTGALTPSITYSTGTIVGCALVIFGLKSVASGVALSGVSETGSVGTVKATLSKAVTGNSGAGSVGTVGPASTKALTGNAGTGSLGTLAPTITVGLSGVSATGSVGTVVYSAGQSAALSGVSATLSPGTLTATAAAALTATTSASSVGTVRAAASLGVSGVSGTGTPGNVAANIAPAVAGVTGVVSPGTVISSTSVALTADTATGSVGTVSYSSGTSVALSGVSTSTTPGSVGVNVTVGLTGVGASAFPGSVSVAGAGPVSTFPGFEVDQRRRLPERTVKPMLVRAMERRLQNVKPPKERAAVRAKAIEFEAAALVLDGATKRDIAPLLQQWEAQRPYIPPQLADVPTLDVFLSQIGFRIEQAQAQKAASEAIATARRQDEDALLALLLA